MDLKPTENAAWPSIARKPRTLDQPQRPWAGVEDVFSTRSRATGRSRGAFAETKGATPPADGPFALAAAGVRQLLPTRTLQERSDGLPSGEQSQGKKGLP